MPQNASTRPDAAAEPRSRGVIMAAVMLVLFLSSLDQTIVGTALPRIVTDLGGSALYTWVVTAYLLASTITTPIYGKFSDVFGRQPMLITGICLFLFGSALSGQAQSMGELIGFRALQGLGAGALFPISLAVIGDLFTPRERGRYQGLFGAVFGLSFIIGPFIGGFLTDVVSWRWIFYVNLPIGAIALAVISTVLHNRRNLQAKMRDLDYTGIVFFSAGVIPLLIGLTNKGAVDPATHQLTDWMTFSVAGLIGIGALLLVAFLWVETKAAHPIIPLYLFRERTIAASNFAVFIVSLGLFSAIIFIPRYYQVVQQMSATRSGYMVWPLLVGIIGASISTGFLISKTGKYKAFVIFAMCVSTIGGFLTTHLQTDTSVWVLWFWLLLMGLGVGPSMSAFTVIIQNVAPARDLGVATSTMTFLRQIGGSLGLAISGTLFTQEFLHGLKPQLLAQGVPPAVLARVSADQAQASNSFTAVGGVSASIQSKPALGPWAHAIEQGIYNSFSLAVGRVFWLVVIAGLTGLVAAIVLREVPLRTRLHGATELADVIPGAEVVEQSA